ncbi:RICIN domain-containing protein [Saccharothrix sp. Mg75]|uniref:RICIN domain-containing protein n=1 Tax=Saccharothrix sp. Mg75 TaxID=3445357 RepID=UPI003EEF329F
MDDALVAQNRTIVLVDVEGFGDRRRTNPSQVAVRAGLYSALRRAFAEAGLPWELCDVEDRGDGAFVLVPRDVPKSLVAERLPAALARALVAHNAGRPARERIRLRLALHAGEVHRDGHGCTSVAVNHAFRLLDARPLKEALAGSPGVLALITSDWFYEEVVRQSDVLDAATFRPVRVVVKETAAGAWVALPDHPFPRAAPGSRRTRRRGALVAACAVLLSVLPAAADTAADTAAAPAVEVVGVGEPVAGAAEHLAHLVNSASGKCLSRNGPLSNPGDSERVGQPVYQWSCAGSHDLGHVVVLTPVGAAGWLVRSSARADLCLTADGSPGVEQRYQVCDPGDDRAVWRLRPVRGRPAGHVVVENANTGGCLSHQGGDPEVHVQVFQRACRPLADADVGWSVVPYALPGRVGCAAGPVHGRLVDHETGARAVDVSLTPVGPSAHGCVVTVGGPGATCLGATGDPRPTDAAWGPCHRGPGGRWVVRRAGEEGGRTWSWLHPAGDLSRCLTAVGDAVAVRPCGGDWLQQWHVG